MKLQLSCSNCGVNTHLLHRRLLVICGFFTSLAVNSIVAISLTSRDAIAIQPPSKVESSAVQNEQSNHNSETKVLPASVLGGEIKLDCPTRLNLLQPKDCPIGGGEESILNIPHELILPNSNQNNIVPESDKLKVQLFKITF